MDRNNNQVHRVAPPPMQRPQAAAAPAKTPFYKKWPVLVGLAVVLVVIAGLVVWHKASSTERLAKDGYQAVFLDNGQVFFGKLKNIHGSYLYLEKAYYSKKQDLPADATEEQKQATSNNVSLVKVGSEVYGPEAGMSIRAEQVLFWQNLASNSKVTKAIQSSN